MPTFEQRIDQIVREVIAECAEVNPPLDRREITRHVVEQLREDMQRIVPSALKRLVSKGVLCENSDRAAGGPHRYWLARELAPAKPLEGKIGPGNPPPLLGEPLLTIPPASSSSGTISFARTQAGKHG